MFAGYILILKRTNKTETLERKLETAINKMQSMCNLCNYLNLYLIIIKAQLTYYSKNEHSNVGMVTKY